VLSVHNVLTDALSLYSQYESLKVNISLCLMIAGAIVAAL